MYNTLCLSGGGVNGFNILGSLKYLIDNNILKLNNINNFIGTSVGSIFIVLLSIGYNVDDLIKILYEFEFSHVDLKNDFNIDYLIDNLGASNGSKIMLIIQTLIYNKIKKYDLTFKDHYNLTKKHIKIVTVNYSKKVEEIFSIDTYPDISIILAIRMSISIPFVFTPVKFNNNLYIDGGVLNNFAFNHSDNNKTLGIRLKFTVDNNNLNLITYLYGLLAVVFDKNINYLNYDNIININIQYERMVDFSPDKNYKKELLKNGYKITKKICKGNINFYCTKFINNIIDFAIKEVINM
jgi:predicted acylesterase/phospholipase RssA